MTEPVPEGHLTGYKVGYSTYINHKCRCKGCHDDWKRYWAEYKSRPGMRQHLLRKRNERYRRTGN